MPYMMWNRSLEVGYSLVDNQHKSLIDAVNRLHEAMKLGKGKDEIGETLHFLADYTVTHFRTEEQLMQRHGYPGYVAHKAIHEDLLIQVKDLVERHDEGQFLLTMKIMDFLNAWLVNHIQGEDMNMGAFLKRNGPQLNLR